jgi:DNA-binding NarL/FixJ family response regulator
MIQHRRLLIADDDPRVRQGLKAVFTMLQLAHEPAHRSEVEIVGEAGNGQEAVALAEQYLPDVVLMDVCMPVMDGLQATSIIKKRWPQMKVVLLTMHSSYRLEASVAGADAFLIKGGSPDDLLKAVEG